MSLTEPETGSELAHVDEQVHKRGVHEDVTQQHDEDVCRVGVLMGLLVSDFAHLVCHHTELTLARV
jgi:hypothetical protein